MALHKQSKRKGIKRSVDMNPPAAESALPTWTRPPPEEWAPPDVYTIAPDGADPSRERVKLRIVSDVDRRFMVEFALVQQTFFRQRWRDVVEVDTCHDVDVHMHRFARSTGARVGDPLSLRPILSLSDVQIAYDVAYDAVFEKWEDNRRRWHDA
ncbi:MAG: hypothetical protein QOD07_36 [Frankiaceae bacterium]|nr:hypothetical protein [Frankiaceae bacterium]